MARSLNEVRLIGRLGQPPRASALPTGKVVSTISIATDESYKDRDGNKVENVQWHRCVLYGKAAEFCNKYMDKGRLVLILGSLRTRKWIDEHSVERFVTEVVVFGHKHEIVALDSAPAQHQEEDEFPEDLPEDIPF